MGRIYEHPHHWLPLKEGGRTRLIRAGARGVNLPKANGLTALIVAAAFGYAELLRTLLQANRGDPGVPATVTPWTSPMLVACDAGRF